MIMKKEKVLISTRWNERSWKGLRETKFKKGDYV